MRNVNEGDVYSSGGILNFQDTLMVFLFQAHSQNCEEWLLASLCQSVRLSIRPSAWNNSALTRWIFMKSDIWGFLANLLIKFKFH